MKTKILKFGTKNVNINELLSFRLDGDTIHMNILSKLPSIKYDSSQEAKEKYDLLVIEYYT